MFFVYFYLGSAFPRFSRKKFNLKKTHHSSQQEKIFNSKPKQKYIFIPLRAEQVSKANLHSEQGGINFDQFVLSVPNTQKKLNLPYGWGSAQKSISVCLSSVLSVHPSVHPSIVPNYCLIHWSD
jgi:hypothetical protein